MWRIQPAVLASVIVMAIAAPPAAYGGSCNFSEPAAASCISPRVIAGGPGQHVVMMDAQSAGGTGTICGVAVGHIVYFEVTPEVNGPITVSTCHPATAYDTVLGVYIPGELCELSQEVACNDDTLGDDCPANCTGRASRVTFDATAGQRYVILVGAYNNNPQNCPVCLGLIVTIGEPCGEPPTNFICQVARQLPGELGTYEVLIDNRDAPSFPEDWSCSHVGHNLWFTFTASTSGRATFTTCHPNTRFDTVVRVLRGQCGGMMVEEACNDDSSDPACSNACGPSRASTVSFQVTAGQQYFIEVGAYNDNATGCELCLGATLILENPCLDDVSPPVAEITSPADFGCVCQSVSILGSAYDADDNLESFAIDYRPANNPNWTQIAYGLTPVNNGLLAEWDTSGLSEGYFLLRLTVADYCHQANTAVRLVRVDRAPSTVQISFPAANQIVGGNVCINGTANDGVCPVGYRVEYAPAGSGQFIPVDPLHPSYSGGVINSQLAAWDTIGLGLPDGSYDLRVVGATDCGALEDLRIVTVDNTAPVAVITAPISCSSVTGIVQVHGTASDTNLAGWVLSYTGGDAHGWVSIATGNVPMINDLLANWDTTALRPCAYTLRLVVTDKATVNCNGALHNQTEYTISTEVGIHGDFDYDNDGDVDMDDFGIFQRCAGGPAILADPSCRGL
ncbi:MAG: hypothetical protein HY718_14045 [Planctomycetes bacterium]|nr:hypothetical protein [Planctomycetota bacterium]